MSHTLGLPFALGTMFPRETGVVRREAVREALVPDPFDESVPDGSRNLHLVLSCAVWMSYTIVARLCHLVLVGLIKVR